MAVADIAELLDCAKSSVVRLLQTKGSSTTDLQYALTCPAACKLAQSRWARMLHNTSMGNSSNWKNLGREVCGERRAMSECPQTGRRFVTRLLESGWGVESGWNVVESGRKSEERCIGVGSERVREISAKGIELLHYMALLLSLSLSRARARAMPTCTIRRAVCTVRAVLRCSADVGPTNIYYEDARGQNCLDAFCHIPFHGLCAPFVIAFAAKRFFLRQIHVLML